ncbi:MAG: hypothetical protein ACYC2I_01430 [Elusimicrobiales bacterium]
MKHMVLAAAAAALLAGTARAGDDGGVLALTGALEAKIQARVLDPVLGPGAAYPFLELKAELAVTSESEAKTGTGELRTKQPGAPGENGGVKEQDQTAKQSKVSSEKKKTISLTPAAMKLRVLHDAALPQEKLKAVREALAALFAGRLKAEDITFVPAPFAPRP